MNMVFLNFKNEFFKLFARKRYMVLGILGILFCIIPPLIMTLIFAITRVGINVTDIAMGNSAFIFTLWMPLIVFMATTDLFCSEFRNNNIKISLMRPISRFKIYLSKILAVLALVGLNLGAFWLVSSLLELAFNFSNALPNIGLSLAAFGVNLFPMLVLILMTALINQIVKSSAFAILICIAIYAILSYAAVFVGWANGIFFVQYMQWDRILVGSMLPFDTILSRITLVLGYGITFFGAGIWLFDRKEF